MWLQKLFWEQVQMQAPSDWGWLKQLELGALRLNIEKVVVFKPQLGARMILEGIKIKSVHDITTTKYIMIHLHVTLT